MDIPGNRLHYPNIHVEEARYSVRPVVPPYRERSGESGEFWLHCETIPERTHLHNWEIAVHRHDGFFQIFSVTKGEGELLGQDAPRRFASPCAIFAPPGAPHGFRFSRDVDGLVVTALADRLNPVAASDRTIAAYASALRITSLADDSRPAEAVLRLRDEIAGAGAGRAMLLEAFMTEALVRLARTSGDADTAAHAATRGGRRFEELETLIAAHYREHRPVSFYADRLGVSPAHLNRIARAVSGDSVVGRTARRLVEAARRELVFTPVPVQSVAYGLGFQDAAYFNRFFRKRTGMTPGAFREVERRRLTG